MKKILAFVLATTMVFSMIACGNNEEVATETTETVATETVEVVPGTANGTVGEQILESVGTALSGLEEASVEDIVALASAPVENYVSLVSMPVEEGYLNGFDNVEIKGFEEGVMFAPMVGTIPFVGYVFSLPADADVDAFVTTLTDSANPRWNICTSADETVVEAYGNKVLFVMCPASFE